MLRQRGGRVVGGAVAHSEARGGGGRVGGSAADITSSAAIYEFPLRVDPRTPTEAAVVRKLRTWQRRRKTVWKSTLWFGRRPRFWKSPPRIGRRRFGFGS